MYIYIGMMYVICWCKLAQKIHNLVWSGADKWFSIFHVFVCARLWFVCVYVCVCVFVCVCVLIFVYVMLC